MNSEKLKGHILILITNILFAVNMPISKYLLPAHVPPEGLTIMRMAFACVMFWIVSLFTVKEKVPLKDLGMLFVCALCGVGINQGLFIVGLNRSSPVDASIIATAVPIFVLLLAAVKIGVLVAIVAPTAPAFSADGVPSSAPATATAAAAFAPSAEAFDQATATFRRARDGAGQHYDPVLITPWGGLLPRMPKPCASIAAA